MSRPSRPASPIRAHAVTSAATVVGAEAPGKIILFGEHAVVYGEPALGVPLSAVVTVRLTPGTGRVDTRLGDGHRLPRRATKAATPEELTRAALGPHLDRHDVAIALGVPPMAGLGSSAALAVALLRARDALEGTRSSAHTLLDRAIEVEGVAHGRSSGVDPAIALANAPILYARSLSGRRSIRPAPLGAPLYLVVATRGGHGGTRGSVGGLAALKDAAPMLVGRAMKTLGGATREGARALADGDLALAGRAMDLAHGVLSGLGLVGDAVEEAVQSARAHGAVGAKMSGAGGAGGALVALAPSARIAAKVRDALVALGAHAWVEALPATPTKITKTRATPRS